MQRLENWFTNGYPYQKGVELYAELGTNKALKTMLGFGENKFNANKLYNALSEIKQTADLKEEQNILIANEKKQEEIYKDPRLSELYRQRNTMHTLLGETPGESDRKRQAFKILSLTTKVERILGVQEDEPINDHKLPINDIELLKLRNNNRSYISKKKNQESKPGEVQRRSNENIEINKILESE